MAHFVVISLERSAERREFINDKFEHFDYEVLPAVDGNKLDVVCVDGDKDFVISQDISQVFVVDHSLRPDYATRGRLTLPQIGCALSHMLVYRKLAEDPNHSYYVVCEDDAMPNVGVDVIKEYLVTLPAQFDVVHINADCQWWPLERTEAVNTHYCKIQKQFFNSTATYIVSKQGAEKLLKATQAGTRVTQPADDLLSNLHLAGVIEVLTSRDVDLFTVDKSFLSTIDQQ